MRRKLMPWLVAAFLAAGMTQAAVAAPAPETITVLGQFDGPQAAAMQAELDAFATENRVVVEYLPAAGELDEELPGLLAGDDRPDLVISPLSLDLFREMLAPYAVDFGEFVNPKALRRDYGSYLIDVVTVDGAVVGAPIEAQLKSLVWYKPASFEAHGYAIPETFDELLALSDEMVADGLTPWCNYIGSGPATGWIGTDWVEDLLLGAEGPAVYDAWVDHDVLFDSDPVATAFERFRQMTDTPGYVFDRPDMTDVFFFDNAPALGADDCLMHKQAFFFREIAAAVGVDVDEFSTFQFPAVSSEYADAAMGGVGYVSALNDRKVVRELARFMTSTRFGRASLADSGWLVPNVRFDTSRYASDLQRSWAEIVQAAVAADQFRPDASDHMPPPVQDQTFFAGIVELVNGGDIASILAGIDATWPAS